jgi:radical SAM superfamily enzyme YgiQ (UPF0313 family)
MNILAINPWIVDFAAYDFWLKPYGFLVILTYVKNKGVSVEYIDCLEKKITWGTFGRGKYYSEIIEKPACFKNIPRFFKRYGILPQDFENMIISKKADYILITSSMTYWYPAINELIMILRKYFHSPIILGGTYATLCFRHAKENIKCDFIFENKNLKDFFELLKISFNFNEFYSTLPEYENFYSRMDYVVLRTSWGCPFSCSYCAIKRLFPYDFFRIPQEKVINFILKYYQKGIKDFVLYDDAFLYQKEYAKGLLKNIIKLNLKIRFHTPNALHIKFLDEEIAYLLKKSGFVNPHFGLETLDPILQKKWGDKVNKEDLLRGINFLKKGGFQDGEFSIYLLLGYPNQNLEELKEDVDFLHSQGAKVSLAEFSPVPQTEIFKEYKDILKEPLLHNNSIFAFYYKEKIKDLWEIKNYVRKLNKKFNNPDFSYTY